MSKPYKYIFFDLDHTLWDFDSNSSEVLRELYFTYDLGKYGIESADLFLERFVQTNNALWAKYNVGEIDKFYLRNQRFRLVFEDAGAIMTLVEEMFLKEFNKQFLHHSPRKSKLMDGAIEVLEALHGHYKMFIITNGFEEVQSIKMAHSKIDHYFDRIITSEKAGFKKPFAGIFNYAMKWTGANPEESIMIGDNLEADIKGARDYGMDQIYYNPAGIAHNESVTHEIKNLTEILAIMDHLAAVKNG
ncbi:YjjG family noncanonical pyrimidine nucleotidase [Reichenbachiella agarivorans]|uniref:YjjG family noncanonical pyrimidine nucleotidase n=1 Tax=Reichenbachiella agarivorans TaxID=2979464 RepID=A0ABY6CSX6_9BACT|nr:YjjG family noncanonical pyrimidine nucleotidase [Reichenbachiella agarivorans]UXP33624.1 YjjG family noncanonical pyrimidine nucleotidase [Reichenbachiella agarivorans]